MNERAFRVTAEEGPRGSLWVPVPFDPDDAWGRKPEHRIHGSINGVGIRASVESAPDGALGFRLGPAWRRDCGVNAGVPVDVVVRPEGPQRDDLAPDIADVFEANPDAGAFFDGLAQFYRRAYLRWIDATKRSPEKRAERIAEVVALLEQGIKQRPGTTEACRSTRAVTETSDDRATPTLRRRWRVRRETCDVSTRAERHRGHLAFWSGSR